MKITDDSINRKKRSHIFSVMALMLCLTTCLSMAGCGKNEPEPAPEPTDNAPKVEDVSIQHEQEFGGVYIETTIEDFNGLGFEYGDSVDIEFSNGYKLEDIPYYNGYYVDAGQPLLIAYPGYDYIKAAINYGEDLWDKGGLYAPLGGGSASDDQMRLYSAAKLDEHCTASVYLHEAGKYRDIQEARDIHYSDDRNDFASDVVFANFRNISMGEIKEGVLYRSASPCDDQHNRASYVDALISEAGIGCILDLADSEAKIEGYISRDGFASPYFLSLYENGCVLPLALNMYFYSEEFGSKLVAGLSGMADKDGPYLVHCTEGKDRTGFVCMLLESLGGASYQEIVDDYMLTYDNYYKITEESDKTKYDTILNSNLIAMLKAVVGDESADLKTADLSACARTYLASAGMPEAKIEALYSRLTGK